MKILQILGTLSRGGAEVLTFDICRTARRFGLDVSLATFYGGEMEADFRALGIDFFDLQKKYRADPVLFYKIRRLVKKRNFRIIHANHPMEAVYAHLACLGTGVRVVLTYHGFVLDPKVIRDLNIVIPRIAANVFCSKYLIGFYGSQKELRPLKNVRMIYNGINPTRLQTTGHSLKAELGLDPENRLIGMICNFRLPVKDQFTVCRALPQIFAEEEDLHFIFAGEPVHDTGPAYMQKCIDYCRDQGVDNRVHFLGGRSDIPDILAELDLFVLSSYHEGLPISVIEAMFCKVPMVLSDIEALREVADKSRLAEFFPVEDENVLAGKVLNLMRDENLRDKLAEQSYNYVQKNFTIDVHMKKLKELYRSLT